MRIQKAIVKTISYRLLGSITTYIIAYIMTGSVAVGLSFAAIDLVLKMALYFLHELFWQWLSKE